MIVVSKNISPKGKCNKLVDENFTMAQHCDKHLTAFLSPLVMSLTWKLYFYEVICSRTTLGLEWFVFISSLA